MANSVGVGLVLLAMTVAVNGGIPLTGYFCATCPANPDPMDLFNSIHPAYSTVIISFAGWTDAGDVVNSWDCNAQCSKNFTLTKDLVSRLKVSFISASYIQSQGRKVLMSLGGAVSGNLYCNAPTSFADTLGRGLVSLVTQFGLDGIDFDIENRFGGMSP